MNVEDLKRITNDYQDVRLISLAGWSQAAEIQPRDQRGPYIVAQEGYDPADPRAEADEFVLSRSGSWITAAAFFAAPKEARRREFMFGTAAEVMQLFQRLPPQTKVLRLEVAQDVPVPDPESQGLRTAFEAARSPAE